MKTILITDCNNHKHNVNIEFIFKITDMTVIKETIASIHLNHKDDNYTFATIKTFESVTSLLQRLEFCK